MAKKLPTGLSIQNGHYRIRLYKDGEWVFDRTYTETSVDRKSDLTNMIAELNKLKARLMLGVPLEDDDDLVYGGDTGAEFLRLKPAMKQFLGHVRHDLEPSAAVTYKKRLNFWYKAFGNIPLNQLTIKRVRSWLNEQDEDHNYKRNYSATYLKDLRSVLQLLFDFHDVDCDWSKLISRKATKNRAIGVYKADPYDDIEITKLVDRLSGVAKAYYQFAFATGMRHQEILALQWSDIRKSVAIVQRRLVLTQDGLRAAEGTKNGDPQRKVILNAVALNALSKLESRWHKHWIFPNLANNHYSKVSQNVFTKAWRQAHKEAHVRFRTQRQTRHTRATSLLLDDVKPTTVAAQLGHHIQTLHSRYYSYIEDQDKTELEKLESNWG